MLGYIFRKDTGGPMCLVPVDGFSELVFFFLNQVGSYPIWKFRLDNQYNVFFFHLILVLKFNLVLLIQMEDNCCKRRMACTRQFLNLEQITCITEILGLN